MTTTPKTPEQHFKAKVPDGWFTDLAVTHDSEEILVVGQLPAGEGDAFERASAFRSETRDERISIAADAERRFGLKVSWGVDAGDDRFLFSTASVPVMTRLRMAERRVLDTLVEAGVARSRSEAMAWCVRHVGKQESAWLQQLRDALVEVQKVRATGPAGKPADGPPAA